MSTPAVAGLRTTSGRRLGIGDPSPRLGWSVQGAAEVTGHRVQVGDDDGFRTVLAEVEGDGLPAWVPWPAAPLTSRQRMHWRVQVQTPEGWTDWASDHLEAGLLEASDWVAQTVSWAKDPGATDPGPSPRFATTFTLDGTPSRARLYVTALGVVDATVNGAPVSDDVLGPGWSEYATRLSYDTYDVTGLLHPGENELAALLGDGWFRGGLLWGDIRRRCHYGDRVALLAQLEVETPGGLLTIATGEDGWTVADSEVRSSDLYDGSAVDLTSPVTPGTVELAEDVRDRLFVRQGPPVRRTEVLQPVARWDDVVDFGQNLAGWVRLRVRAEQGQTLTVRHAEVLDGKALLTTPLRTAKATDTWVLTTGEHVLEPRFTFHGFRYAEITTDAEVLGVEAVAVHSDLTPTATFSCSDPRLEQLHSNVVWGQRGNFLSVPTDCPQRDERLGWTGDAQVFAATAGLLHDSRGFFADWLADLQVAQLPDGRVPIVVPNVLGADWSGIAGWSDAVCVIPWEVAVRSGDVDVLRQALPAMTKWVDWVDAQRTDGVWVGYIQLGDWLDPDAPDGDPWQAKADGHMVATAVAAHSARLLAHALEVLGEDGSRYHALAREMGEKAWERWGSEARSTQTGCALFLRFGLVPETERHAVARDLAQLVEQNDGRIGTGFLGTPEVLFALSDTGHVDAAYRLLLCDECPSWLYAVAQGATTMWERWDAVRPDGTVNLGTKEDGDPGMLSFNHYAYGAVAAWMHEVLAGLAVRELPSPTITIAPRPGGGLTRASSAVDTPRGRASIAWELTDVLEITAEIPPGYAATFDPPPGYDGEPTEVTPGAHTWRLSRR
jgi:alpha-L-rhamnosidase